MADQTEEKVRNGLQMIDRSQIAKPSELEILQLVQETRKKQRREAVAFVFVALLLTSGIVLTLAKVPIAFIVFYSVATVAVPMVRILLFQRKRREKVDGRA